MRSMKLTDALCKVEEGVYIRESIEVEDGDSQLSTAEVYVKAPPVPPELVALTCVEEYSIAIHERDYVSGPERPAGWVAAMSAQSQP